MDFITWERFLVLWGFVAPGIAWAVMRWWEMKTQAETRADEKLLRLEQAKKEQEAYEASCKSQLHNRMRDTYSRFLTASSTIKVLASGPSVNLVKHRHAMTESLAAGYSDLLMIASCATAKAAVEIYKACTEMLRGTKEHHVVEANLQAARAVFMAQARKDLEDPVDRNANTGITVEPAISIGGFHLKDVG